MFTTKKNLQYLQAKLDALSLNNMQIQSVIDSINRSTAIIEFNPDGTVIIANDNFLNAMGYNSNDVIGRHHRIFCDKKYVASPEYSDFWHTLNKGSFFTGRYERITKSGERVWLEASYNPVFNQNNELVKVVKFATIITDEIEKSNEQESIIAAINRSNAVIEFSLDGKVICANNNFLVATGYQLTEIVGKHHRIFCPASVANSSDYQAFWQKLNAGEFVSGLFERVDNKGETIWLEASYNPIFNSHGELAKIVKFASNVTERVKARHVAKMLAFNTSVEADKTASHGSQVVEQAINLMSSLSDGIKQASDNLEALNKQSDQINNIINTISSIAEQTNLLALNAAIEAARAGEQGRGFAVVADEVRGLAARTSSSTTEIADVIKQNLTLSQHATDAMTSSIEQVNVGVELVETLSDNISNVTSGIGKIVVEMDNLH